MLFDADTHFALLASAVIGTVVLGLSMRWRHTWSTVLIWAVPICLILSATDALLGAPSALHRINNARTGIDYDDSARDVPPGRCRLRLLLQSL